MPKADSHCRTVRHRLSAAERRAAISSSSKKQGKQQRLDIKVDWVKLSGGAAVNDALLSGSIDIAGAGVGPLLTIWDRTHGKQNVKGVASLGNFPYYLVSNNPNVKTIADFSDKDRIALPAVGVSVQSRVLQYGGGQACGATRNLPPRQIHANRAASGCGRGRSLRAVPKSPGTSAIRRFRSRSWHSNPNAHIVLNSYDVLGGPSSSTVLYATEKFRNDNPKTYRAFVDALQPKRPGSFPPIRTAADIYLRINKSKYRSQSAVEGHQESASAVQDHAAKHVRSRAVHASRRRDQKRSRSSLEGLLLRRPGDRHWKLNMSFAYCEQCAGYLSARVVGLQGAI
jgi:hypothetical protein